MCSSNDLIEYSFNEVLLKVSLFHTITDYLIK